jgi:hypothetical protein
MAMPGAPWRNWSDSRRRSENFNSRHQDLQENRPMDNSDLPGLFVECLLFDYKSLLTNPDRLGPFLSLCKLMAELEEEARHAAIALAMREVPIPGWTLVRKNGHAYVEAGSFLELLQHCPVNSLPALLSAVSNALGNARMILDSKIQVK